MLAETLCACHILVFKPNALKMENEKCTSMEEIKLLKVLGRFPDVSFAPKAYLNKDHV